MACAQAPPLARAVELPPIIIHADVGLGRSIARPLQHESTAGFEACAGLDVGVWDHVALALEVALTTSMRGFGLDATGDNGYAGDRSLTTVLVGLDYHSTSYARHPFVFVGAGFGHASLTGARDSGPANLALQNPMPSRTAHAFAFGLALGLRSKHSEIALRTHALLDASGIPAQGVAFTLGIVGP